MLNLFLTNLLPIFLVAGAGYLLASRRTVNTRSVAHVGFYILAPCLVLRILVENDLQMGHVARLGLFVVLGTGVPAVAAAVLGKLLGWSRKLIAAVTLCVLIPNTANFGLSAVQFAFGDEALAQAGILFIGTSIVTYTAGVLIASMGRATLGRAFRELLFVPSIWAVVLGGALAAWNLSLPLALERPVFLLADACIPVFLLVLGMQLRTMQWKGAWTPISTIVGLRLVGGAVAGILFAKLLGIEGPAYQASVLEAAMPVAVINIVLATEYEIEPEVVTSSVFLSTLLCPLTLTPLMKLLS